jgi:hypothetical protein
MTNEYDYNFAQEYLHSNFDSFMNSVINIENYYEEQE